MRFNFFSLLLIIIFSSCETEVSLQLPQDPPLLVCNSFFKSDTSIAIFISESAPIEDKLFSIPSLEKLLLYENNICVDSSFYYNDSLIEVSFKTIPGNIYSIEMFFKNGLQIFASDTLPKNASFQILDFIPQTGFDQEGYEYSEINIEINDDRSLNNYYEISIVSKNENLGFVKNYVWSDDVIIANEGDKGFYYYNLVFSDILFIGEKIKLKCYTWYDSQDTQIYIYFRSISQNYYNYKKSLMRHLANQKGDIWTGSGNPVDLYSNIEGGYGIFAGYQEIVDTIYVHE